MEGLSESGFAIMVVLCIDSCIMNSLFFYLCWKGVYILHNVHRTYSGSLYCILSLLIAA
jgi:hypothetical protein